jgi:transcriptional regulator with XRE-family HTH domain
MPKKRGRKPRPRTTAEKLLMVEVSEKFETLMEERGWSVERAAKELEVSRASFYNYCNKSDLASFEVLKKAHDRWGLKFKYIDFGANSRQSSPTTEEPRQYVLPFIANVRERDVEIIKAKSVKPDTLQLTVNIKFAG